MIITRISIKLCMTLVMKQKLSPKNFSFTGTLVIVNGLDHKKKKKISPALFNPQLDKHLNLYD